MGLRSKGITNGYPWPESMNHRTYEEIYGVKRAQEIRSKQKISHLDHVAWNKDRKSGPRPEELKIRQSLTMKERIRGEEIRPYRSKGIKDEDILNLWHEGFAASEISRRLGSSVQNILKRLRKLGASLTEIKERGRRMAYNRRPTSIEIRLMNIINENTLPYRYVGNGTLWINNMNPDFIHKEKNLVVEVLGNHWHNKEETEKRRGRFIKSGFRLIEIWESELKTLPEIEIIKRLSI